MRKVYTNLIQATLCVAMVILVGSSATAQCDIPFPDKAVYGTQFDGGLDGWTALDGNFMPRVDDDGNDIGWEWHDPSTIDSRIQDGAFAGNAPAYASASACNGAVLLNSDFLDNLGVPTFGAGACPGGACASILLSPTIDLSGSETTDFVIQMATQHRQFTSGYSILVSVDDGATWTDTVTVFPDGYIESLVNSPHLFDAAARFPVCGLTNSPTVRLAILYDANYYYWILDDIYVIEEDQPDVRVNDNWFGTVVTYGQPAGQETPLAFIADISNQSPVPSTGSTLNVEVTQNGNVVHQQSLEYPAIDGCTSDENRVFPLLYTPEGTPGDMYSVSYTINDAAADASDLNNTRSADFVITADEYIKVIPESQSGLTYRDSRFGAATVYQSFGSGMYVKSGTNAAGEQLFLEEVFFGLEAGSADADPLPNGTVTVAVYEWVDVDDDGEADGGAGFNEKVKVAEATLITIGLENERAVTITPVLPESDPADRELLPLKDDTQYVIMLHFNPLDGVSYMHTVYVPSELNRNYFDQPMEFAFVELPDVDNYIGTMGSVDGTVHTPQDYDIDRTFIPVFWGTSMINAKIGNGSVSADDINEDIGINVYPNPASDKVAVDIALEETSDVTVEVTDVSGKVALVQKFSNVTDQSVLLDVSELANGMYVMNIRTKDGINTQKFTVQNTK